MPALRFKERDYQSNFGERNTGIFSKTSFFSDSRYDLSWKKEFLKSESDWTENVVCHEVVWSGYLKELMRIDESHLVRSQACHHQIPGRSLQKPPV